MRLRYLHQGASYDIDARFENPATQVADLAAALGLGEEGVGLFVDGLHRPADTELEEAGLHEGAVIAATAGVDPADRQAVVDGQLAVLIVSGVDAGGWAPMLEDGEYLVGRGPECHIRLTDPTVSRRHCRLTVSTVGAVTVTNESGGAGTRVGGVTIESPLRVSFGTPILLGSATIVVDRIDADDQIGGYGRARRYGPTGTISFNRPPRVIPEPSDVILDPPTEPTEAGKPPFNVVSLIAPLGMGLAMALLLNPLWAMFALMSPVMVVGNWWESKHRSTKALRTSTRTYARDLATFEQRVAAEWQRDTEERRAAAPSVAHIGLRAALPSVRLWERRPSHDDFLTLSLGYADVEWKPKLAGDRRRVLSSGSADVLGKHRTLFDVPATVDLRDGGVVGIAGDREVALQVAASLTCQAAALHGPADVRIAVLVAGTSTTEWEWAKWLPHTRESAGGSERRLIAAGERDTASLVSSLVAEAQASSRSGDRAAGEAAHERGASAESPTTLFVIDGDELLAGRAAPARRLLSGQLGRAAGIVIAPTTDRLPAVCTEIVEVTPSSEATTMRPHHGRSVEHVRLAGLAPADAARLALDLAPFDDPELHIAGAGLPSVIRLGALLGVDRWTSEAIARRWATADATRAGLSALIGSEEDGPFRLDFDRHGPHGLIGGTTGSGKSELLKSIVASLAASYPPDQLTFGLFDFKGGSTFTELGDLPHTVGMASDLDVNLARRALRCLRAELLHREMVFDQVGVADLVDFHERRRRGDPVATEATPLPRLIVIIDEFAAMAKELSEEIGAIADLTARGRSLGVHLLLATQKPSTAVNAEIRTNTRLRISLKVEDRQDSVDVVGMPDAAAIDHKGRGYFRVGQGEVLPIQSALSTGPAGANGPPPVVVLPFAFEPFPPEPDVAPPSGDSTELAELVAAVRETFARSGQSAPRRPWPDPLPKVLTMEELAAVPEAPFREADDIYFALGDDPDRQTRYPVGWPLRSGNLLLYGVVGSGTTTALATIALDFARRGPPASRHIYVLHGTADLAALEALPHCAAVVRPADRDRQIRLLRRLIDELDRRRGPTDAGDPSRRPDILVVVDNLEGFRTAFEETTDTTFWDRFVRLYSEGPEVGIYTVGSATRVGGIPSVLSTATPNKLLFRLADAVDYGAMGVGRASLPTFVPGRAILPDGQAVQVARAEPSLEAAVAAVAAAGPADGGPEPLSTLGPTISLGELHGRSVVGDERWDLAVGRRDRDLRPAVLSLFEGEHALVAGRGRSGKSTALLTIARAVLSGAPMATVLGVASRRSPLSTAPEVRKCATTDDELAEVCNMALMSSGPTLVLVDDAELIEDPEQRLASVVSSPPPQVHVVAAGNADALRSMYGHWTQTVRRNRAGLLLQPALDRDGELLTARLPYRVHGAMPAGRGFLVCNNEAELIQTAS